MTGIDEGLLKGSLVLPDDVSDGILISEGRSVEDLLDQFYSFLVVSGQSAPAGIGNGDRLSVLVSCGCKRAAEAAEYALDLLSQMDGIIVFGSRLA